MQAYDVKRNRLINIERMTETGAIAAYTVPNNQDEVGKWYFPLIVDGKNFEPYKIIEHEQISLFERT